MPLWLSSPSCYSFFLQFIMVDSPGNFLCSAHTTVCKLFLLPSCTTCGTHLAGVPQGFSTHVGCPCWALPSYLCLWSAFLYSLIFYHVTRHCQCSQLAVLCFVVPTHRDCFGTAHSLLCTPMTLMKKYNFGVTRM